MANFDELVMLAAIENLEIQEIARPARRRFYPRYDAMEINDNLFLKIFRLTKDLVSDLIDIVSPHMQERRRSSAIDVETKVLTALNFYASGSYQLPVGSSIFHAVSQSSVSRCITEVTEILNRPEILNNWIRFPRDPMELNEVRQRFFNGFQIPGVIGCVDCTHVAIFPPKKNDPLQPEYLFVNRKNYHSLNVQLICDLSLKIMSIDSRFPGSTHDSHIWINSNIEPVLRNIYNHGHHGYFLLGDSGYALRPWLLTPIQNPLPNSPEERYNSLHKRTRATIERCNGVLKARFRCLLKHRVLHYDPVKAGKIVNACSILHNICVENGVQLPDDEEAEIDFGMFENEINMEEVAINGRINPMLVAGRLMQQRIINQLRQ